MKSRLKTLSQWIVFGQNAVGPSVNDRMLRSVKNAELQKSSEPSEFTVEMSTPKIPTNAGGTIVAPVWRSRYCHVTFWRSRTGLSVTVGNGITARRLASMFTWNGRSIPLYLTV